MHIKCFISHRVGTLYSISVAKSYEPVSNSRQNIVLKAHLPHTQFPNVELGVNESLGVGGGGKVGTKTIHVIHHYLPGLVITLL